MPATEKRFLTASMTKLVHLSLHKHIDLRLSMKAILHRGFGSKGKGSHERLCSGDVIQLLLPKDYKHKQFLTNFISDQGIPHFFKVGGFVQSTSGTKWAIVKQCSTVSSFATGQLPDHTQPPFIEVITPNFFHPETQSSVSFVELDNNIRKVGVLHNCAKEGKCKFSNGTRGVEHSATTLGGGNFFILTRSMGYPPRRS